MLATKGIDLWLFEVAPHAAYWAIFSLFIGQLIIALCVLWLATYTRTLLQFFGVVITSLLLVEVLSIFTNLWTARYETDPSVLNSRTFLALLIFIGGLAASLIVQYGFRRTRSAFILGAGSICLTIMTLLWWPFVIPGTSWPPQTPGAVHLTYGLDATKPLYWNDQQQNFITYKVATVSFTPPDSAMEGIPVIRSVESTFQPEGDAAISLSFPGAVSGPINNNSSDWLSQVQKENPDLVITGPQYSVPSRPIFMLAPSQAERVKDKTGTLSLKISGNFISLHKEAEIPLEESAFARIPDALVRIKSVRKDTVGMDISVREVGYVDNQTWSSLPTVYLLVDRKKRTGLILTRQLSSSQMSFGGPLSRISGDVTMHAFAGLQDSSINDLVLYVYEETAGPDL